MLFVKYMMLMGGLGMFIVSAIVVAEDIRAAAPTPCDTGTEVVSGRAVCRTGMAFLCLAWAPILMAMSLLVRG